MNSMELFGAMPPAEEADPRPLPGQDDSAAVLEVVFGALSDLFTDTCLESEATDMLWNTVNIFQRKLDHLDKGFDQLSFDIRRALREQDGSEVKSVELEKLEIRAEATSEARACFETLRDQAADIFAVHTGQPWMPGRGSRTSTSAMTAAVIDSREFLAATERKKTLANRPIAAFNVVKLDPKRISPRQLFDVLLQMHDKPDSRPPNLPLNLDIQQAFEVLNTTTDLSVDEMAELEFRYIRVLKDNGGEKAGRVPNLEKYLARNPDAYVEAIRILYKQDNDTGEPDQLEEEQEVLAQNCFYLLKELSRIPGWQEDGTIDRGKLTKWVSDVREGASKIDRLNSAERNIGELFTNAPADNDGVWPCEAIRDTMEEIGSRDMSVGFCIGEINSRGVVSRGKGGDQERELADKYRKWMQTLQYTHPFVSGKVLCSIVKSYEGDAKWYDNQDKLDQRLSH